MSCKGIGVLFFGTILILSTTNRVQKAFALEIPAFGAEQDCGASRILIRQADGRPIAGAVAVINGSRRQVTSDSGVIDIDCRSGLKLPAVVEASAAGYRAQSMMIGLHSGPTVEIVLRRQNAGPEVVRNTVTVGELSLSSQERSKELQKAGLEALRRSDFGTADRLFREALELTPSSPSIYNNIGVTCARRQSVDLAASWFEKAFVLAPDDANIAGNLGIIRWLQGQTEESYRLLQSACSHGHSLVGCHLVLGLLALRRGSAEEAVRHFSKVSPKKFPDRDLYLSVALTRANRLAAAAKNFRSYLEKNPIPLIPAAYGGP